MDPLMLNLVCAGVGFLSGIVVVAWSKHSPPAAPATPIIHGSSYRLPDKATARLTGHTSDGQYKLTRLDSRQEIVMDRDSITQQCVLVDYDEAEAICAGEDYMHGRPEGVSYVDAGAIAAPIAGLAEKLAETQEALSAALLRITPMLPVKPRPYKRGPLKQGGYYRIRGHWCALSIHWAHKDSQASDKCDFRYLDSGDSFECSEDHAQDDIDLFFTLADLSKMLEVSA